MKWLVFTGACVAALISLGILAVDERNVEWEGRKVFCPYCRTELEFYAVACKECGRTVDWEPRREPCRWCLSRADVRVLRDGLQALQVGAGVPLPGSVAEFTKPYLLAIAPGKCTYCGGLGQVVDSGEQVPCPVCRGDTNCIACGGTRYVIVGDKRAHLRSLERKRIWEQGARREALTQLPLRRAQLVGADVTALAGYAEAESIEDEQGRNLLQMARQRIERAFKAIHEAHDSLGIEQRSPGGS